MVHHYFYSDCNMKRKEQTKQLGEELVKNWKSGDNYKKDFQLIIISTTQKMNGIWHKSD